MLHFVPLDGLDVACLKLKIFSIMLIDMSTIILVGA